MIWLTWRQFRGQAMLAAGAVAVVALYTLVLGLSVRGFHDDNIAGCAAAGDCETAIRQFQSEYRTQLTLVGALLIGVPAIIGAFWGAPLVARELEAGTHRLVWNQSITRVRWLTPKVSLIGLVALAATGLISLMLTWAASPYDAAVGDRFSSMVFNARNIAPLGYALFAFALGVTAGLMLRRTVPAMALALTAFAVLQVAVPFLVRPNLFPPRESAIAVNAASLPRVGGFLIESPPDATGELTPDSTMTVQDYALPGALVLTSSSQLLTASGKPANIDAKVRSCLEPARPTLTETGDCLAQQKLHFNVSYQPAQRYWMFQWVETGLFTLAALLLIGFCRWRITRLD
ncbi:ABC transporter permease subunit [Spirillospora sp. CA-253888]